MGFELLSIAIITVILGLLVDSSFAQPNLYSSQFDSSGYAHKIEFISNDCTLKQDQYAIYFWHRFSFTTPKYQGNVKPMALARLTSSSTFSDSANYSDRVMYVESDGVSLTVCSHDTVSQSKNVCKSIDISAYRYDMEWVFMYLQYRREGLIKIYVKFLAQQVEINSTLSSVLNDPPGSYLGLRLGGNAFLPTALNGWFFHANILLGFESQISTLSGLTRIMNEQPPYDYIQDQHISIPTTSPLTVDGIYTRIGFYGTFSLDSSVGSTPVDFLQVNGVDGQTGVVGTNLINVKIVNDNLVFTADNYNSMAISSDDAIDSAVTQFSLTVGEVYRYYIDLNMESNNIRISCTNTEPITINTVNNRRNFIPSRLIITKNPSFTEGRYFETNLVGSAFETNSTEYFLTRTQDSIQPEAIRLSLASEIKQFSFCYWFRLSSLFPIMQVQTSNSANLVTIPLISLTTSPTAVTDCTQVSNFLTCAYLSNYQMNYQAYNSAQILSSIYFDYANVEWQWNSSCFVYKAKTDSTPSITKAYQLIGTNYKETSILNQDLVLTPITNLYLQMYFSGQAINKQFYNIRVAINTEYESYIDELNNFSKYTKYQPFERGDTSQYVANVYPGQSSLALLGSITYDKYGLQFVKEYGISLWAKLSTAGIDATIAEAFIDSSYSYVGRIFKVFYDQATNYIYLYTYTKYYINLDDNSSIQVVVYINVLNCDLTKDFFIYAGFSKFLNQARLGVICDVSGVTTRKDATTSTIYHLPIHSFHLLLQASNFSGTIAQVRAYFGLNAYESRPFIEPSLGGKWECAYKTFSCSSPQLSTTAGSKKCKDTYAYDTVGNQCLVQCPCGYFSDSTDATLPYQCIRCNNAASNCLQCVNNSDSEQCTFCDKELTIVPPSGSFSPDVNKGVCQCTKSGYVQNVIGPCVLCSDPCVECVDTPTKCTKCSNLAYLSGNTCLCIDGYYMDAAGICQPCGKYCQTCQNSASYCLSCHDNQFRMFDSGTNSCLCDANYAEVTDATTGDLECEYCNPDSGQILTSQSTCDLCDGNCLTCITSKQNCVSCDESLKRSLNSVTNTCDCNTGYYSIGSSLACVKCDDLCKECVTSSSYCTACTDEKILTTTSATTQTCLCDKKQYLFTTSSGLCELVTLKANLTDYYSTTATNLMHFRIIFTNSIDQAATMHPSKVIESITMKGLDNSVNPIQTLVRRREEGKISELEQNEKQVKRDEDKYRNSRQLSSFGNQQSFYVSMRWENSSTIFVEVEFFKSFMYKDLFIKFVGNQFVTSAAAGGHYLLTQNLTLPINLAVYTPADDSFTSVLDSFISFGNSISNSDSWFVQGLMYFLRDCYVLLVLFPFFSMIIVLLSLSTILPTNFFHFLRMFSHLIMLRETAMQEENSQAGSIYFLFTSRNIDPNGYRDRMEDNFKRLNFTNSFVVMACAPFVLIVLLQLVYIVLNKVYEYCIESYEKKKDEMIHSNMKEAAAQRPIFKGIRSVFVFCNTLSSLMIKNLQILISTAAIINLKCQFLVEYEQVFGYVLSFLMFWGLLTYALNLFSIFSNRLHYEENAIYKTYSPFVLYVDAEKAEQEEWDEIMDTVEFNEELYDREMHFASHYKTPNITFRFFGQDNESGIEKSDGEGNGELNSEEKEDKPSEGKVAMVLKKIRNFRRFYHLINLARKVILLVFIVVFSGKFQGQMVPFLVLQVFFIGQIAIMKPKEIFLLNICKIIAEVALLVVIILVFVSHKIQGNMQSDYADRAIPDEEIQSFLKLGSVMIAFMCLYMVVLLATSSYEIIVSVKRKLGEQHIYFPQPIQFKKENNWQNQSSLEESKSKSVFSKKDMAKQDKNQDGELSAEGHVLPEGGQVKGDSQEKGQEVQVEMAVIEKKKRKSLDYTRYNLAEKMAQFQLEIDLSSRNSRPFLLKSSKMFKKNQ